MKLQELLNKHKDKLWDWLGGLQIDKIARENHRTIVIDLRINDEPTAAFSLCDLLFSTPFLSLLERKREPIMNIAWLYQDYDWELEKYYENDYRHHKINLVLLNSDAERIEYIEKFTL